MPKRSLLATMLMVWAATQSCLVTAPGKSGKIWDPQSGPDPVPGRAPDTPPTQTNEPLVVEGGGSWIPVDGRGDSGATMQVENGPIKIRLFQDMLSAQGIPGFDEKWVSIEITVHTKDGWVISMPNKNSVVRMELYKALNFAGIAATPDEPEADMSSNGRRVWDETNADLKLCWDLKDLGECMLNLLEVLNFTDAASPAPPVEKILEIMAEREESKASRKASVSFSSDSPSRLTIPALHIDADEIQQSTMSGPSGPQYSTKDAKAVEIGGNMEICLDITKLIRI